MIKDFIAYGRGYSGDYNTREEAEQVVRRHGQGDVYQRQIHLEDAYQSLAMLNNAVADVMDELGLGTKERPFPASFVAYLAALTALELQLKGIRLN